MEIPKPSDEDKARFRALVPEDPRVEVKPMFGNLGAFVNGNMFTGLFGPDIGVKLPADELKRLAQAGGGPFGPAERPMGGYVTLASSLGLAEQEGAVASALAFVAAQPAKKPKKPKKAK
ncbi:MAG TPA: TfoX/Sxy family protein [Acidimicrobiales bacterium]|jgi:TfoX/Sxy family transcriptional regulator of competence genes|nr:TfoX/Sxy family protein [Acidimicrobiales bacterium]